MGNLLLISDKIPSISRRVKFLLAVIFRAFIIFFRFDWRPKLTILNVNDEFLFKNGYLFISWRTKNIVWIKINKVFTTDRNGIVVEYSKTNGNLEFVFKGLFNSVKVTKTVMSDRRINTEVFKCPTVTNTDIKVSVENLQTRYNTPSFAKLPLTLLKSPHIKIKINDYN